MSPRVIAAVLLLLTGLGGCGIKPAPFAVPESELGGGPGLLSGPSGEFVVFHQ